MANTLSARLMLAALGAVVCLAPMAAMADQEHDPEQRAVIEKRINRFRDIGTSNKNLRDELKLPQPDINKIRTAANEMVEWGKGMPEWFPDGTGRLDDNRGWMEKIKAMFGGGGSKPAGIDLYKTKVMPTVFSDRAGFQKAYEAYGPAAEKLAASAAAGDIAAVTADVDALNQVCGDCHKKYRYDEE